MKSVIFVICAIVICAALADETHISSDEFKCDPETRYKENDCNNCRCLNGKLACTFMSCEAHHNGKTLDCLTNPITPKQGEECWCFTDMGKVCTTDE